MSSPPHLLRDHRCPPAAASGKWLRSQRSPSIAQSANFSPRKGHEGPRTRDRICLLGPPLPCPTSPGFCISSPHQPFALQEKQGIEKAIKEQITKKRGAGASSSSGLSVETSIIGHSSAKVSRRQSFPVQLAILSLPPQTFGPVNQTLCCVCVYRAFGSELVIYQRVPRSCSKKEKCLDMTWTPPISRHCAHSRHLRAAHFCLVPPNLSSKNSLPPPGQQPCGLFSL